MTTKRDILKEKTFCDKKNNKKNPEGEKKNEKGDFGKTCTEES